MHDLLDSAKNCVLPHNAIFEIDEKVISSTDWLSLFPRNISEEMSPSWEHWATYVEGRKSILCFDKIMNIFHVDKIRVSKSPDILNWVSVGQSADSKYIIVGYCLKAIHEKLEIVYLFDAVFKNGRAFPRFNSILYDPEQHKLAIPKLFIKAALRDHAHALEARAAENAAREKAARRRRARNEAALRRAGPVRRAADLFDKRRRLWMESENDPDSEWNARDWADAETDYDREKTLALAEPDPGERWVADALREHGHPMLLAPQVIGRQADAMARTDFVPLKGGFRDIESHHQSP